MKHRGKLVSLVVLIIAIALVIRVKAMVHHITGDAYQMVAQIDFNQNNDFEYRAQILTADHGYWIVDPTALFFVDDMGKLQWQKPLASQNVEASSGKNKLLICEKKAGDLFLVHTNGKVTAQVTGIGELNSVRLFDDQYAVVLKKSGELLLFDAALKLVSTAVLPQGEILDFKMTPDGQNIIVAILDLKNQTYNSKLVFIAKNGNIISGTNLNNLFLYQFNMYDDSIVAMTDEAIVKFKFDGTLLQQTEVEGNIKQFAFHPTNSNLYMQVFNDTEDLVNPKIGNQILKYDYAGEKTVLFDPPMASTQGIDVIDSKFIFYDDQQWIILNEEGKLFFKQIAVDSIQEIHVLDDNSYAVEYINRLDIYKRK